MGIDATTGLAFTKSQMAAGGALPETGQIFFSLADRDKPVGVEAAALFTELGFTIAATTGTADALEAAGVTVSRRCAKVTSESGDTDTSDPTAVDLIAAGEIQLVVNSPRGRGPRADGAYIRAAAGSASIPLLTTGSAALAAARGMREWLSTPLGVRSLQSYHAGPG
jgi:carbamoyl-phosphate synthase large subunit